MRPLFMIILIALAGCIDNEDVNIGTDSSYADCCDADSSHAGDSEADSDAEYYFKTGQIVLKSIDKPAVGGGGGEVAEFDLGDIPASREFLFLIQNTGTVPINNLNLSINNSAFEVWPRQIGVLDPVGSQSIVTLIAVRVNHGISLDGIGLKPLLPMGANQALLQLSGITTDEQQQEVPLEASAVLKLNAQVFQFEVNDGNGSVATLNGYTLYSYQCQYTLPGEWPQLYIKNTGNVSIDVTFIKSGIVEPDGITPVGNATLLPGESAQAVMSANANEWCESWFAMKIYGGNVVSDLTKMYIGPDGNVYTTFTYCDMEAGY